MNSEQQLLRAIQSEDVDGLKKILEKGGDVNRPSKDGTTLLECAVGTGNEKTVKLLLDAGADVDKASDNANHGTPLTLACSRGDVKMTKMLVAAGADVNKAGDLGLTPILHATSGEQRGHLEVLHLLIKAGANLSGGKFFTPLMAACRASLPW
jgi:ankyrin repeat protein